MVLTPPGRFTFTFESAKKKSFQPGDDVQYQWMIKFIQMLYSLICQFILQAVFVAWIAGGCHRDRVLNLGLAVRVSRLVQLWWRSWRFSEFLLENWKTANWFNLQPWKLVQLVKTFHLIWPENFCWIFWNAHFLQGISIILFRTACPALRHISYSEWLAATADPVGPSQREVSDVLSNASG